MQNVQSIVVATDFSGCAGVALRQAARIARKLDAELHVVHVIAGLVVEDLAAALPVAPDVLRADVVRDAQTRLEAALTPAERPARCRFRVAIGSVADETLRSVRDTQSQLLVLGSFGVSGPGEGAGSVALHCARRSPSSVLLVQESMTSSFRSILACLDFSDVSLLATRHAAALAAMDGASLGLLHVFNPPWKQLHYRAPTPEAGVPFQTQYRDALLLRLRGVANSLGRPAPGPALHLHEHGSEGRGIVEFARSAKADLVVLGTEGRTSLKDYVMGSTAERVIRKADSSVLAVRSPAS